MRLAQRCISDLISAANSSGLELTGSAPPLIHESRIAGLLTTFTSSALRRRMIGVGVLAGATMPPQSIISNSGIPSSAAVGTWDRGANRFGLVTTRGTSLADWIYGKTVVWTLKLISIWFPNRSGIIGASPL